MPENETVIRVRFAAGTEAFVHGLANTCKSLGEAIKNHKVALLALERARAEAMATYEAAIVAPKVASVGDDDLVPGGSG